MYITTLGILTFAVLTTLVGVMAGYVLAFYLNPVQPTKVKGGARNMREARAIEKGIFPTLAISPDIPTDSDNSNEPRIISPSMVAKSSLKDFEHV